MLVANGQRLPSSGRQSMASRLTATLNTDRFVLRFVYVALVQVALVVMNRNDFPMAFSVHDKTSGRGTVQPLIIAAHAIHTYTYQQSE